MDKEYNSGLSFSYNYIMPVLKNEYLKLDINKLETCVNKYMEKQNEERASWEGTPSVAETDDWGARNEVQDTSAETAPSSAAVKGPSSTRVMDPSSAEPADPASKDL